MKILKYITLIGLTVYGQSIFAMEQIEKAVVIQKMSLRDLAKYRAKMNELAEGMPNARQRAKFRDAYMEQIKLALAEKAAESLAMSSLPTKGATEIKQYIKLKLTQQFPEYSKSQSSPEFTYYIILADAATPSPNAARKKLFVDAWGAMQSIIESAPVQDRLGIAKELDTQAQTLAEALFGNSPELSDKFKDTYLPWFNFISTKLKEL